MTSDSSSVPDAKHILIVDDEPRVALFLSKALEHSSDHYRISVARSGEEALEVFEHSSVDLLVTDLRMPGISGLELMRWVRTSSPSTRTILITAYGDDEVEAEARRLEAYRYITKPFDIGDFTDTVQEALRNVAISRPGLAVLSDKTLERIAQQLDDLRHDIDAYCIILADILGQRLAEVGITDGLDTTTLLSLLAGEFAVTDELAQRLRDDQAVNLNFHEGTRYEIYSANVGENLFITIVYNRQIHTSRIGLVWLYTRRTIERLLTLLATAGTGAVPPPLDTDFGSSLISGLDALLTESLHPGPSPQREKVIPSPLPLTRPAGENPSGDGPSPSHLPAMDDIGIEAEHGDESDTDLLDLGAALAQGLLPPDWVQSIFDTPEDQQETPPQHEVWGARDETWDMRGDKP